jgi:nucleoid-associated protein YgaU
MSSLQAHLERHDLAVNPLEFRRDCPLCRAERVQGQLPASDGELVVADATATGSDTAARRAERETEEPATYRVRAGDSLWRIAAHQLGSHATATATAQEVTRLWELNRQRIGTGNPDLIFPGQTLKL